MLSAPKEKNKILWGSLSKEWDLGGGSGKTLFKEWGEVKQGWREGGASQAKRTFHQYMLRHWEGRRTSQMWMQDPAWEYRGSVVGAQTKEVDKV